MSEPQPPAWWQPPPERLRPSPPTPRPHFRERRPVRWWTVLLGLGGAALYFALVAIAARGTVTSITFGLVTAAGIACVAASVLTWRGDLGLGIGVAMVTGLTISVLIFVVSVSGLTGEFIAAAGGGREVWVAGVPYAGPIA